MSRDLEPAPQWANAGQKKPIRAGDMDQDTLKAGSEVTVWSKQCSQDQLLFHGHGPPKREFAEAFVGLQLEASGNGAGAVGDDVTGDVVIAIMDSEQKRVLASAVLDSLDQLRESQNESRTDRIVESALGPYAKPGRHLVVRVEADSNSDGVEIDPAASSGNLYYTVVNN